MTNEEHLEEILMEAYTLKIEREVFDMSVELRREYPRLSTVDLFEKSLKKVKENVLEVTVDSECGIFVSEFDAWKQGDMIKAFELIPKKKSTF